MRRIFRIQIGGIACLLPVLLLMAIGPLSAQDDVDEGTIAMIAGFLADPERDVQAMGFQQIAEDIPGEAATKKFAEMLPDLSPALQVGMLDALATRGDVAALPVVIQSLQSEEEAVRAASLEASGSLGTTAEIPLLIEKVATGTELEKSAARKGLVLLKGDDINQAIQAALAKDSVEGSVEAEVLAKLKAELMAKLDEAEAEVKADIEAKLLVDVQVELLGVLADRNAKEALPSVLEQAENEDPTVRQAAFKSLRLLADENHTAAMVELLKKAENDAERRAGELTLLTVCSRGGEVCAEPVAAGMDQADPVTCAILLRVLARAGGPKALEAIVSRVEDEDADDTVRDEAVRMLSRISDPDAIPHLLTLAESHDLRYRILAIRGLVRQARPQEDKPANVELLNQLMNLATRTNEKRLVLGQLGSIPTTESLLQAASVLDDTELADEAKLAAISIANKIAELEKEKDESNEKDESDEKDDEGDTPGQQ